MDNLSTVSGTKDIATKEYVDGKITQSITDGVTTTAPSENAVYDALALKAVVASPTFTGTPAAPTAAASTNTTQLATTAFVMTQLPGGFGRGVGTNSVIEGINSSAGGNYAHAEGDHNIASAWAAHAEGTYTVASGLYSHAEGEGSSDYVTAYGEASHAEGIDTQANNTASHAEGYGSQANAIYSHAEGEYTATSGEASHAEGNTTLASGLNSHAEGYNTTASGTNSHASGKYNTAKYSQLAMGQYGTVSSSSDTAYNATGEALLIGNGTGTEARGLAFKVMFDGKTYADGAYASTGADYAEYFEWLDGNENYEDRVGYFVTLDGEKIRKALSTDAYILGVISATPSVVGDNYEAWQSKYITDDWGRVQYHDVTVPTTYKTKHHRAVYKNEILITEAYVEQIIDVLEHVESQPMYNPDWDPTQEYITRDKRKEWSPVGIVGKLLVRDDGTCQADGFCKSNDDGIATASVTGYRVLKRVSANIIQVFLK